MCRRTQIWGVALLALGVGLLLSCILGRAVVLIMAVISIAAGCLILHRC